MVYHFHTCTKTGRSKALYDVEPDVQNICKLLANYSRQHIKGLEPSIERYGEAEESEPDRLRKALFPRMHTGAIGLLRDLHDVSLLAHECRMCQKVLQQVAKAPR